MPKQNVYDDDAFFGAYTEMRARRDGLHESAIRPVLPELLSELRGARVVDLGCGDGWLCRHARELGAATAVGIDPSARMLALARERTHDPAISYVEAFAEDGDRPAGSADAVLSVLALHYVLDLERVLTRAASWLVPGGALVVIVEHPVYTARGDYFAEGEFREEWLGESVVKVHRTVATYVQATMRAGFRIECVLEPAAGSGDAARSPSVLCLRARREEVRRGGRAP